MNKSGTYNGTYTVKDAAKQSVQKTIQIISSNLPTNSIQSSDPFVVLGRPSTSLLSIPGQTGFTGGPNIYHASYGKSGYKFVYVVFLDLSNVHNGMSLTTTGGTWYAMNDTTYFNCTLNNYGYGGGSNYTTLTITGGLSKTITSYGPWQVPLVGFRN